MELKELVKNVINIAREAGNAIMEVRQNANFEVKRKGDASPVTIADLRANAIILDGLHKLTPEIPIISEENEPELYARRQNYDYVWLVDPLDGTQEFVDNSPDFSVNIALVQGQKPILGVVYMPNTEGVYFATHGGGSFFQDTKTDHAPSKISVNVFKINDLALRIPISRTHFSGATRDFITQNFREPVTTIRGSAVKFLMVAEGSADVYPRIGKTMEWDTAAPQIIIEEAGGTLLQLDSRQPLIYNKADLSNPNFIASGRVMG